MALTSTEMQSVIDAVISSLRTNAKTIDQLTPVSTLADNDQIEVSGGKRVAYSVLKQLIGSMSEEDQASLRVAINNAQLKQVNFGLSETTATLQISSVGKTIMCQVPLASVDNPGFMTPTDKVKVNAAYDIANAAQTAAQNAANAAQTAQTTADKGVSDAAQAKNELDAFKATKGAANGIAPLDANGKIPTRHIPGSYNDVVEFAECVSGITAQTASVSKSASDVNCSVVYNTDTNRFVMRVLNLQVPPATPTDLQPTLVGKYSYYNNWNDASTWGTNALDGIVPDGDKVYVATVTNKTYRWSGSQLVVIGSDLALGHTAETAFPGDEGKCLQDLTEPWKADIPEALGGSIGTISVNDLNNWASTGDDEAQHTGMTQIHGLDDPEELLGGKQRHIYVVTNLGCTCGLLHIYSDSMGHGLYEVLQTSNWVNARTVEISHTDGELHTYYRYLPLTLAQEGMTIGVWTDWKELGGGNAAIGNTYNVTIEQPKSVGYYTLEEAISATQNAKVEALGMSITFAIARGSWKTYQYVGESVEADDFSNTANWIDLAGMSAGSEAVVNIDSLVPRNVAGYYTKDTAIDALLNLTASTAIDYAKLGLVITYRSGEYKWETYQFTGAAVSDFSEKDLWVAFGGGGSDLTASPTPEKDGTDAFSTGGAYDMQRGSFAGLEIKPDADDYIIQGVDRDGNDIGEAARIPKSNGTGAQQGSTLSIYLEHPTLYAAFGSDITMGVAIKSVSFDGDTEILGVIKRLDIVDATTGLTLVSTPMSENCSTSATDYRFTLDFTPYFTGAAQKDFQIVAVDADGNVKRRTVTVTAVDVTCQCVQPLTYTADGTLAVNGGTKDILLYKFPNNVSKQGVEVTTEMYYNGQWRQLGKAVITDTYSHSVTINASNVFGGGEKLTHGSYPLRVSGVDVASGVEGNTITTAVMCVDPDSTTPIVSLRYDDRKDGTIRLYDTLAFEVAAYTSGKTETQVSVFIGNSVYKTLTCQLSRAETITKQVQGYATDGTESITFHAQSGIIRTPTLSVRVLGSAIDARLKEGAAFAYDFFGRSNSEPDHTISDKGVAMAVSGSNWSSNGFCQYLGEQSLRIAEGVTAEVPYRPFGTANVERSVGMAFQFAFATNNVKDDDKHLVDCYDPDSGAGFYVCGNKAVIYCKNGNPQSCVRPFRCGEKITMAVTVEPSTDACIVERGTSQYATMKMYLNGEEVACIGYIANSGAILSEKTVTFDGTEADLYLYYVLAYNSYYEWAQAFQNYLCKLTDVDAMTGEYEANRVLDAQNRPSLDLLKAKAMPYYVVVANQETFNTFDGDIDTSAKFTCDLYYFHPEMPWRSFHATNVQWRRQGTTSAKRPIKNDRFYLNKPVNKANPTVVTPLYPDYDNADAQMAYRLMAKNAVRVTEDSMPVSVITVKVDYSDSSNSNDCGVCDIMNHTFRALAATDKYYITPAQRAFDGTWTKGDVVVSGLEMNHSTANHPIAAFRATQQSLVDAWFHAKGNWKEDKGEQVALGFKNTPGYNLGCLNYGDFVEFFANQGETLAAAMVRFKGTEGLDTSKPYVISQYCGRDYVVMRYSGGEWARSNGSMQQVNGRWVVQGDVVNPVTGYELITYDQMDWWQGVGSVSDMMAPTSSKSSWVSKLKNPPAQPPAWTRYFECMVDDDQLQEDLAWGRKVPYELYAMLLFCNSVDYSQVAAGTWKPLWRTDMWKRCSVQSLMAYYTFTDYLAAVDQQAKNMQPMFFLEDGAKVVNGTYTGGAGGMEPIRMYLNKVYDCDTCNGMDNDGGNTIPSEMDPADTTKQYYAGRGSVLWNDLRGQQEMVVDANGNTLTLPGVVKAMRTLPEVPGVGAGPFSPAGAMHYFMTLRAQRWPKVVSSYDGERKYIRYTGYNDIYFYALQGLRLTSLPAFIEQRWRIRDGYYQCGDFMDASHVLGGRIGAKAGAVIKFKAAKSGYFGIGNDGGNITQGMYLQAGESGEFSNFQHGDNVLLYLYQADRMAELDLSQLTLDPNFQFSVCKLAEKLILGGTDHRSSWYLSPGNTGDLSGLNLGDLPFLKSLDVRNTEVTNIDASKCPRLESVLTSGSKLTTISLAETSPVSTLQLTDTMTELSFVNLPNLTYPGGLTIGSMANVRKLMLGGCPNIDPQTLLEGIVGSGNIRQIRLPDVNITAPSAILAALKASGAVGLDPNGQAYDESGRCSGIVGRWIMSDLIADSLVSEFKSYFPQLEVHNSQYSHIVFSDEAEDSANITNEDNKTGYKYNNDYVASGHFLRLEQQSKAYMATYNSREGKMHLKQLDDTDYNMLADGTSIDLADAAGVGFDIMKDVTFGWYKGVNDFKNQEKHLFESSLVDEPISGATKTNRHKLSDILVRPLSAIFVDNVQIGSAYEVSDNPNMNVYAIDVEGMKQVRWPGLNSAQLGAVFVDGDGKVMSEFHMLISHALFDFVPGEYVFTDVPAGAKRLLFTTPVGFDDQEAIAVDSAAIEAIEPDWVFIGDKDTPGYRVLVGVYGMSLDGLSRARSVSGAATRTGDGTSTLSTEWTYDKAGNLTNTIMPTGTLHYCGGDLLNICRMRGAGFTSIDYETSKNIANVLYGILGDRDASALCGYGRSARYTTGDNGFNSLGNTTRRWTGSNNGNVMLGLQNFIGCNSEWEDNVGVNVTSVAAMRSANYSEASSYPSDGKWHIYDPITDTERIVQGVTSGNQNNIVRVKFGRHADIIPSRISTDTTAFSTGYTDATWYSTGKSRVPLRSGNVANAYAGLAYANAASGASYANTYFGARLAFRGVCVSDDE